MKKFVALLISFCMLMSTILILPQSAFAAENWLDGWSTQGTGKITKDSLVAVTKGTETGQVQKSIELTEYFDIEWTMRTQTYGGDEAWGRLATGTKRFDFSVLADGLSYKRSNNSTAKISYPIGDQTHTYRVINKNGTIDVYIDGYFVETTDIQSAGTAPGIYFGANKGASITVSNVTVHPTPKVESSAGAAAPFDRSAPAEEFEYNFDGDEDLSAWEYDKIRWNAVDGVYRGTSYGPGYMSNTHPIADYGDDFIFQARFKLLSTSHDQGIVLRWHGLHGIYIKMRENRVEITNGNQELPTEEIDLSAESGWHDIRVESFEKGYKFRVFIDDKLVMDDAIPGAKVGQSQVVYIWNYGTQDKPADIIFDWMKLEQIEYDIELDSPMGTSEYFEGQTIPLAASVVKEGIEIPSVEYKIKGQTVATGYAPDYKANLKNIPVGKYEITAECGEEYKSMSQTFEVFPAVASQIGVNYKGADKAEVYLDGLQDTRNLIAEVEYRLAGEQVGKVDKAPYKAELTNFSAEGQNLTAICRDKNGLVILELAKNIIPDLTNDGVSLNYSNEILYRVVGENGDATLNLANGRHMLEMTHTPDGITYQTKDGEEQYEAGTGTFQIFTDGPYAEVYRNGQLAFSFIMPQTTEEMRKTAENGLEIEDLSVTVPENRINHFVKRNVTDKNALYQLPSATESNVIDFLAGAEDNAELVLNDGNYLTKLMLKDGKFSVWTVKEETDPPYEKEIGVAPEAEGDVYYRVDISAGISRLYANGEFIAFFRSIPSIGAPSFGVNVTGGDGLSYLAVSDYTDMYVYQDDFKGTGGFDSADYWRVSGDMGIFFNNDIGLMTLNGQGKERAIAELNAYVGDADFSADVNLNECNGGFWLVFSHSVEQMYSKMGYNAKTGKFEVVSVTSNTTKTFTNEKVVKEEAGEIPVGKTFRLDLKQRYTDTSKQVTLYIDGNPVMSHEESNFSTSDPFMQRGKVGFMLSDGVAQISNFAYRGDAKPMLSVYDVCFGPQNASTFDLLYYDNTMILANNSWYLQSDDDGKSWRGVSKPTTGTAESYVQLANGEWMGMEREVLGDGAERRIRLWATVSTDHGASWSRVGRITEENELLLWMTDTGNRVTQGASGRIYYIHAMGGGSEADGGDQIRYSDDNGRTWHKGLELKSEDVGHTIHETKAIELPNGVVRVWARNERGCILYFDSYDGGKTYANKEGKTTPFIQAAVCFNVEQDPNDRNILYLAFSYDNANLAGMIQYPRTRVAVAKSTDGGENWDYIGTVHETTHAINNVGNMGINITDKNVVVNWDSATSTTGATGGRYVTFPRDKQVSLKRFEKLHLHNPSQLDALRLVSAAQEKRTVVIDSKSNTVLWQGDRVDGAVYGDAILPEFAAIMVGTVAKDSESGGVDFLCGDAVTTFDTNEITEYDGRKYVKLEALAEKYDLSIVEEGDLLIVSNLGQWGERSCRAFRYALNPLTNNMN